MKADVQITALENVLTNDREKRYNFTRRQRNLMNVLHRPVEIATHSGHLAIPVRETLILESELETFSKIREGTTVGACGA